ncbi:MAG: CDP-alcohol phosphatidyltransferase family protein [Dehalococcoidia bacterium]|nr:CDP-alcohol phosphatidyltransferase family protein [Dehalococcoidia bacterium]
MNWRLLPAHAPAAVIDPAVRVLAALRITPTMLTTAGLAGNAAAALLTARGALLAAGVLVLAASTLDLLDGALARATDRASRFGALYDSTLDRISEAAVLFGIAWYAIARGQRELALLAFAAVVGSLLVSYVRARAEGLGLALRDGLFTRSERVVLTGAALITGWLRLGLWLLAVLALLTALQRLWIASRALLAEDAATGRR